MENDAFSVSGFVVPTKKLQKANKNEFGTIKPDRITVDIEGCNVEPPKNQFLGHRNRHGSDIAAVLLRVTAWRAKFYFPANASTNFSIARTSW
jgi:hypothetical protein